MLLIFFCHVRRFPPVGTFTYAERTSPPTKTFLYIPTAEQDPMAWGDDAHEFLLRPLETYAKLSVAWADPALVDGDNGAPNSRACPGKDLSIAMVVCFMRSMLHCTVGAEEAEAGAGFDRKKWTVVMAEGSKAKAIDWNGFGLKHQFAMERWREVA
jgi:hypothetical protein